MGNAINSSSIIRAYPKNPPACTQCPPGKPPTWVGGFIDTPSQETCDLYFGPGGCTAPIQSAASLAFLPLYLIWAVTIMGGIWWTCMKRRLTKNIDVDTHKLGLGFADNEQQVGSSSNGNCRSKDTEMKEHQKQIIAVRYYRTSAVETPAIAVLILNGIILLAYWLLLTIDFYVDCEFPAGSTDNACFFGTFRLFGNYENNAEHFFLVWSVLVVYSLVISLFLPQLLQYLRIPCSSADAHWARVFVKKEDDDGTPDGGVVSFGLRLARMLSNTLNKMIVILCKLIGSETFVGTKSHDCRVRTTPFGRRYFIMECVRYDVPGERRINLSLDDTSVGALRSLYESCGLNTSERKDMVDRCGPNEIPLEPLSTIRTIRDEFTQPFYAYQLTIYLIWIWWTYWVVGVCLLAIVIIAGLWSVRIRITTLKAIQSLASSASENVSILTRRGQEVVKSSSLVCGDVVRISSEFPCVAADLVLVKGSCAVDESGLSGENIPKGKNAIPHAKTDEGLAVEPTLDSRWRANVLFSGTKILEASEDCYGVVLRIGVDSTRGKMLSRVLFPPDSKFKLDEEFPLAIGILFIYSICAFAIAMAFQASNGAHSAWPTMLAYGVFTVSQIVSPMLKVALVAGRVTSEARLKRKGIVCLDTRKIDVAGKVKVFCFDKTGTLTKDALVFRGVIAKEDTASMHPTFTASTTLMRTISSTCHSLSIFKGKLLGSPLEMALVDAAGAELDVTGEIVSLRSSSDRFIIKRRLLFDPSRRMMSCVIEDTARGIFLLVSKGAVESLSTRCKEYNGVLVARADDLSQQGFYVLGMTVREFPADASMDGLLDASRDDLEQNLDLQGLVVFANELKEDAAIAIRELKRGEVRTVMVTGDNAACAMYVARECGMIETGNSTLIGEMNDDTGQIQWRKQGERGGQLQDPLMDEEVREWPLVISDGKTFDALLTSGMLARLLSRIVIFARMNPIQKASCVNSIITYEGSTCAFVGDGANDAGALRQSSVGLSMSPASDSVVASFTCSADSEKEVMLCVDLLCEGRCSLATSLSSYKLLVIYGLLFSIVKLASFYFAVLMPILGYIMIDVVALVPLTFLITLSRPLAYLRPRRPTSSLLGAQTVGSVVLYLSMFLCALASNLAIMRNSKEYVQWPNRYANTAAWWYLSDNFESSILWVTCFIFFASSSIIFSFGADFRKPAYFNWQLVLYVFGMLLIVVIVFLLPVNQLSIKFHIASEQFNRVNTQSPVWQAYQAQGGSTSPGMSFDLRFSIFVVTWVFILAAACIEKILVFGECGRRICRRESFAGNRVRPIVY